MINSNIKKDVISFEIKGKTIVFCHEAIASSGKSKKYFAKRSSADLLKAFKEASSASTKDDVNAKYLTMRKLFSNDVAKEIRVDSSAMSDKLCRKTKYCATASNCQKAFELLASGKTLAIADKVLPIYNTQTQKQNVKSKTAKKHIKPTAKKAKAKKVLVQA